jgi:hypothetical protein
MSKPPLVYPDWFATFLHEQLEDFEFKDHDALAIAPYKRVSPVKSFLHEGMTYFLYAEEHQVQVYALSPGQAPVELLDSLDRSFVSKGHVLGAIQLYRSKLEQSLKNARLR